jgi:hypothetical protein
MNFAEYFRMRNYLNEIYRLYGKGGDKGKCLDEYMRARKRSGGVLRRKLETKDSKIYIEHDPRNMPSSITLWGNNVRNVNRVLIEETIKLWGYGRMSIDFRQFVFNMVQGKLYLNNTLHRINPGENDGKCTFCKIFAQKELRDRGIGDDRPEYPYYLGLLNSETINHIFWECDWSKKVINTCFRWMTGRDWYRGEETVNKEDFMIGTMHPTQGLIKCDVLWKTFVKYYIYKCRYRRIIPQFCQLRYEMEQVFLRTKLECWDQYRARIFWGN